MVRELFEDSVKLRLRSDVPVGVCLSGGLDSTSIICAAARALRVGDNHGGESLLAFCYMAPEFDETVYIADILADTAAQLRRLETNPVHLWEQMPTVLWHQDEPVHSLTAVVGFELIRFAAAERHPGHHSTGKAPMRRARNHFKLLQGLLARAAGRQAHRAGQEIRECAAIHGGSVPRLLAAAVQDVCQWQLRGVRPYRALAGWRRHARLEGDRWFRHELALQMPAQNGAAKGDVGLNAALKHSVSESSLPLYLRVEDRNSMAHSVEVRLPFLDYRLVSLLLSLGSEWKLRGAANKFVLRRRAAADPESVRMRVTDGLPNTGWKWLAGTVRGRFRSCWEAGRFASGNLNVRPSSGSRRASAGRWTFQTASSGCPV
jgi:asparagine synthase (glutamine-hydrolysing)